MKIFAIVLAVIIAIGAIVGFSFVSAKNWAVTQEATIEAADKERKGKLTNYEMKVVTAAQVPEMYRDDLTKVVRATVEGRYGEGGSKAVFQMITEANITYDSTLYKKIQDLIEIGRNDYAESQSVLNDRVAIYKAGSQVFPRGFILGFMGYPRVNFKDYEPVLTDRVEEAFKTKKETAIKLR